MLASAIGGVGRQRPAIEQLEDRRLFNSVILDPEFGGSDGVVKLPPDHGVTATAAAPGGKTLVVGTGPQGDFVARLTFGGALDTSFGGGDGITPVGSSQTRALGVTAVPGGKIVVAGSVPTSPSDPYATDALVIRLNDNGTFDSSFSGDGRATLGIAGVRTTAEDVLFTSNGKITISGDGQSADSSARLLLARVNANGTLDTSFGDAQKGYARVQRNPNFELPVSSGPGGRIYVGDNIDGDLAVRGFTVDGRLDTSFGGGDGLVTYNAGFGSYSTSGGTATGKSNDLVNDLVVVASGDVVVLGERRFQVDSTARQDQVLLRLSANGSFVAARTENYTGSPYGPNGTLTSQLFAADNKLLVTGSQFGRFGFEQFILARFNADLTPDTTFNGESSAQGFYSNQPDREGESNNPIYSVAPDGRVTVTTLEQRYDGERFLDTGVLRRLVSVNDNVIAGAPLLPLNTPTSVSTVNGTDVALRKLVVTAGQTIHIDLDNGISSGLNSYLRLFNASGAQLAASDNNAAPGESPSNDSFIPYTFGAAGTYYVGVSGTSNRSYNPVNGSGSVGSSWGQFTLTAIPIDPVDPNDRVAAATPAQLNATRPNEAIDVHGLDVDLFRVTVAAGQSVGFDVDTLGGPLDSYLRLFDAAGNQLATNDNGVAPGEGYHRASYLAYTFPRAGTYHIGVSGKGNAAYDPRTGEGDKVGSSGRYALDVRVLPTLPPPADTNDRTSGAYGATLNAPIYNQGIAEPRDVDLYRVTVLAGQRVGFDVDTNGSPLDAYLRLFDASGRQLATNDDGAAEFERLTASPYHAYTFATAGTYYVGISGKGNAAYNPLNGTGDAPGSTGAYSLAINDLAFGGASTYGGAGGTVTTVDVAFDAMGNRYVLSDFNGKVDFDPGQGITTRSTTTKPLRALAKYAPDDKLIYVVTVTQSNSGAFDKVVAGPDGSAYMGWNVNTGSYDLSYDIGVDRIAPDGTSITTIFTQHGVSDGYPLAVNALAVGPTGIVYFGGYFNDGGGEYAFIYSRNADGSVGPLNRSYSISAPIGVPSLAVSPSGDVYAASVGVLGNYEDPSLTVSKIDGRTGSLIWQQPLGRQGNTSNIIGSFASMAYDATRGQLVISGNLRDAIYADFDPTAGVQRLPSPAGDFVWTLTEATDGRSVVAGRGASTIGTAMRIDAAGNVYVAGTFSGTVDANPGTAAGQVMNVTSAGGTDAIVTKLTRDLQFIKAFRIGGSGDDTARAIAVFNDDLYLAGSYRGTVDFLPGNGTANRTAAGVQDGYVVRIL